MVRIVVETSLPARSLPGVQALLEPGALPEGALGHMEQPDATGLCAGPARGGPEEWVPCWISLQFPDLVDRRFSGALRELRAALVAAARAGGAVLQAIPAAVQDGDTYLRVKDLADLLHRQAGDA